MTSHDVEAQIEAVARAIAKVDWGTAAAWGNHDQDWHEAYRCRARAAIAALPDAGKLRAEVLEEAAKVALEDHTPGYGAVNARTADQYEHFCERQRAGIAARIRALSPAPPASPMQE